MSLLMQALKKAERAKQNALSEEELDKPSTEFDEVLALTPEPAPAAARAAAPFELSLEPMDGLSLEPLAPPVAAAATPRPSPSPLPSASDHRQPGLTMDLAPDPAAAPPAPAPQAAAAPVAPRQAGAQATPDTPRPAVAPTTPDTLRPAEAPTASDTRPAGAPTTSDTPWPAAAATTPDMRGQAASAASDTRAPVAPATSDTPPLAAAGIRPAPATAAAAAAAAASSGAPSSARSRTEHTAGGSGGKPRAADGARARARSAATAEPTGLDPERLRLFGLIAILVLLVGGFGIYYWRALTAPGAGANLPAVPMPPAGATGASPVSGQIVIANGAVTDPAAISADSGAAGASNDDPMLAPAAGSSRAQQELERRLARTEQELAAAQQAIQAAAQPRAEQMPVLAAPDNSDIRVTRQVQPAPVSPTLEGAYQAFNRGDAAGAQQQYEAALAQDANNRDALLGAAHAAARQNQKDKAAGYYLRLLELAPNDADATAGLIGLRQGDISQSETRLKGILANNPDAGPLLFALGNLYAQQGRWSDAQQAYFRAVGAVPDNPDYAYNLAIGLDRLNQGKLAIGYYQRALALAQDKAVGFDRNALRKRLHELTVAPH